MKPYYDFTDNSYPEVLEAILERLKLFICTKLYPDETYDATWKKRFVLTDMSPNMQLRGGIKILNLSNATFPFTTYSIEDPEKDSTRENSYAQTKNYYSSIHSGKIHAYGMMIRIPMITFFSTAKDYGRARTILHEEDSLPTKLTVPITINDVVTSFVIYIDLEIGKGTYAFEFEQQLVQGNIFDLVHNIVVYFHQIVFDGDVSPVDDIIFELANLETPDVPSRNYFVSGSYSPATPTISSIVPLDEAEDVSVNTDVTINFSSPMNKDSVEDNFSIFPYINADFNWNSTLTQLVVDILDPLVSGTTYEWSITDDATDVYDIPFEEDYDFDFTTE